PTAQPASTANTGGREKIVGRIALAPGQVSHRPDIGLRRVRGGRAARVAFKKYGSSADCRSDRVGGKVAREDAVGRKVAIVGSDVVAKSAGNAVAGRPLTEDLAPRGCKRADGERDHCRSKNDGRLKRPVDERFSSHGLIVPQSPFHPVSLPLRNCR